MATPLLYQHLRARRGLDAYWAREKPKSRSLHQTLERNPSLGAHCKSLQLLNIRNLESQTSFVHNICSWLPNVKYLSLEQDTTEPVSDVLNASLQRLPQLEELDCKCHWAKPTEILASIYAEARTLRRLSISGGRGGDSVRSDRAVIVSPAVSRSTLPAQLCFLFSILIALANLASCLVSVYYSISAHARVCRELR